MTPIVDAHEGDRAKERTMDAEIGSTWGYWTVVRAAAPAKRGSESFARRRVMVRCVCGTEQLKYVMHLREGKSLGCRRCIGRRRVAEQVRATLGAMRFGSGVLVELLDHLDHGIDEWLSKGARA